MDFTDYDLGVSSKKKKEKGEKEERQNVVEHTLVHMCIAARERIKG